tara:strand:- start:104 stop:502 length:399 start_codon:yes stop_codon:yes gene_type:complete
MPSKRIKSMTKSEFDKLSNKEIANLSMDDAQYLMSKFMKGFLGQDESDIKMRKQGGMMKKKGYAMGGAVPRVEQSMAKGGAMMKKKGYAMGGAMKKKGYAKGGAMKKKGYAKGGAMSKRMGHTDYRKGGMFK